MGKKQQKDFLHKQKIKGFIDKTSYAGKKHQKKSLSKQKTKSFINETPCVDMHIHSDYSFDGGLSVANILDTAMQNQTKYFSITDHNTLRGTKKALRLKAEYPEKYKGITPIPGVEITCEELDGTRFHLLAYDFDVNNPALNQRLDKIREQERASYYAKFTLLEKNFGITFSPYEIVKAASTYGDITWDVVAQLAVLHFDETGKPAPYAKTKEDFLTTIKNALQTNHTVLSKHEQLMLDLNIFTFDDVPPIQHPTLDEILPIIKEARGIPVLAHPRIISFLSERSDQDMLERFDANDIDLSHNQKVEEFLQNFKRKTDSLGMIAGMEVFFGKRDMSSHKQDEYFLKLAEENGLLASGGSDIHGPIKTPFANIGTISNHFRIIKLPLVSYITNGRQIKNLLTPSPIESYFYRIDKAQILSNLEKNYNLKENYLLKKASKLKEVSEKFGNDPFPIYSVYDKTLQINRRIKSLECITSINHLVIENAPLLKKSEESKENCLKNVVLMNQNNKTFIKTIDYMKHLKELIEKFDTFSKKQEFVLYITTALKDMEKQLREFTQSCKQLYNKYYINPKASYRKTMDKKNQFSAETTK